MNLLLIIGLLIYAAAVWWRPHWGIYIILFLLPSYQLRFTVFNIPSTLLEWLILLLVVVVAIKITIPNSTLKTRLRSIFSEKKILWPFIIALLLLFAAAISVIISPQTRSALGIYKAYFLEASLFGFLCVLLLDTKEKLLGSFKSLSLLVIVLSLFGIYQFLTLYRLPPSWWGPGTEPRRVVSIYTYPNAVALLVGPIIAIFAGLLTSGARLNKYSKTLFFFSLVSGVVLIILTFSRGAWLGGAAALAALALLSRYRRLMMILFVSGLIIIAVIPATNNRIVPALTGTDPAGLERVKLYEGTVKILSEEPVFGSGLYSFRDAYTTVKESDSDEVLNYPHNFFLNFWVETGLLGLVCITSLLIWSLLVVHRLITKNVMGISFEKAVAVAVLSAIVMMIVHGMVDVPYFKNDLSLLFWFIVSLPVILIANQKMPEVEIK